MQSNDAFSLAIDRFEMAATDGKVNSEQVISILQSLNYNPIEINKIVSQITSDIDVFQFKQLLIGKDDLKQEKLSQSQTRQVEDEFKQAVKFGNVEKVSTLLKKYKGQMDLANKFDLQTRQIPTYEAVQIPDEYAGLEILRLLKDYGADIFYRDYLNQSIMFYICRDGRTLLFDFLTGLGLSANEQDSNGQTPLFYAARENRIDVLQKLIKLGANVNHRDKLADQTALFYSAKQGQFEACKLLVEAGCKISHQDVQKKTALSQARKYNRKECLDLLMAYAVKQKEEQQQKRDDHHQKNIQRKRPSSNVQQKQQYKFMFIDDKGLPREVTNEDFEKFQQIYPEVAKLIQNPDETIDEIMISSIKEEMIWEKTAKKILDNLRRSKYSLQYFNEPVDVERYNIMDYYDIVKHPMDLGTIKSNLNSNKYRCFKEFHNDVILVFHNCVLYNGTHSEVGQAGLKVKSEYQLLLEQNNIHFNDK